MKKQFQSLTEKGRWLLATLTLIFTLGIGQMLAADPDLSVVFGTGSGTPTYGDYINKSYTVTTGISVSINQYVASGNAGSSWNGTNSNYGYVGCGSSANTFDQHNIRISASGATIDSISFLITSNGSTAANPAIGAWSGDFAAGNAQFIEALGTLSTTNTYAGASWTQIDVSDVDAVIVGITRKVSTAMKVNNTAISAQVGNGQNFRVFGVKVWLHKKKVTLNPNGGAYASTPTGWTISDGKCIKSVFGGELALPEPAYAGNTFAGWKNKNNEDVASPITVSKDTVLTAQWTPAGGTTHDITYTNTKGATNTNPATYYEGVGVASFNALADVADFHFNGWSPASIAADATTDQTISATWVAAYNVTFSAGAGSGTVPASFQKWEGATFDLPDQGSMVAPSGKAFDGWKANGTGSTLDAGSEYTMGNAAVNFVAQWKAVPTTLYSLTVTNTSSVNLNNGGAQNDLADDATIVGGGAYMQNDHASSAQQILSSTKLQFKAGTITLVMTLNNALKEGDTIKATGLNSEGLCFGVTFDRAGSLDNQLASDASYFIVPEGFEGKTTLYAWRHSGSGTTCASIIIRRPAQKDIKSTAYDLTAVKINGTAISAANLATLKTGDAYLLDLADEYAAGPTVKFARQTTITYDDDSQKVTNDTITVTATEVSSKWQTQATIGTITYTVKMAKVSAAKVYYYDGATKLGEEIVAIDGSPVNAGDYDDKNLASFVGWYNNSDLAEEHKIANIAELVVTKDTTVYGKWNPVYATSANIEQWVLTNGTSYDAVAQLGTLHYASNIANSLDSLNDDPSKDNRNYAYLGLKIKASGKMLDFRLANGQTVKVKFGATGNYPQVALNGGDYAAMSLTDNVWTYTAEGADAYISIKTANNSTVVIKQVMINEDLQTVTLPWRVTYDANGGTCATAEAIWSGAALILPDVTPADADHTFAGWYDEVSGGSLIGAAGASYTPTDNTTLHAHFAPVEYAVNYAAGDHGSGDMAAANVGWGTEYTAVANGFTPETGYIFAGWTVSGVDGVSSIGNLGSFTMPKGNVTLTAIWEDNSKVAMIVETSAKYESLADAIAAAEAGQTIQLLQDIEQANGVAIAKNLTLDLNGKTYTCTSGSNVNSRAIKITAGNVTIQNGSIIAVPTANFEGGCYGPIRIEGATANVTLEDLTLQNGRHYGLGIKLVEGYLRMEDCTVISENGGGGLEVAGTADVINCTFTQTGLDNAHAWISTCLATCDNGVLNVQGGSYTSEHYSMYVYTSGGEMDVESGSFTGDVVNQVTLSSYPDAVGAINISGGTFEGAGGNPIQFTTDNSGATTIAISGGTFDAPVENQYCAPGYVPSAEVAPGVYTVVPKDGVEIIGVVVTGNTTGTVSGLYKGDASVNLNDKKIDSGKYIYVTLKDGYTFEENDVLIVDVKTKASIGTKALEITTGVGNIDGAVWKSIAFDDYTTGENIISLEGIAANQTSIGLKRSDNQNSYINGIRVLRPMKPMLTAITIDGRDGVIDEANKTVAVQIPYEANLAALTVVPTIVWNEAAATNSIVVNDGAAWTLDDNTYKLTDKDNDYTVYTITLTRDVQKHAVKFYDGETLLETVEVEDGESIDAGDVPADPTKEDYVFQGWAETADGAVVDVTSFAISATKNFYAKWAAETGVIKLLDGEGNVNTTNFTTGVTAGTVNFDAAAHNCAVFGSTGGSIVGLTGLNKVVAYNATTTQTKVKFVLYNANGSAKELYLQKVLEGATEAVTETISVPSQERFETQYYTYNSSNLRSFYVTVNSTDVKILQIKVVDDGTDLKRAGEAGYELNLNQGRVFGAQNTAMTFEGLAFSPSSNAKVLNSTELQIKTPLSFTIASPLTLTVETSSAKYYVSQNSAEDGTTATAITSAGEEEFDLTVAGTWYIVPSTTSAVKLTNLAFALPKAEKPVVADMDNVDYCQGSAIDELTVVATVSDGGTKLYQWYHDGVAIVGAEAETYQPTADGEYYVIVVNTKAGHQNSDPTQSNTITVAGHDGTAISGTTGAEDWPDANVTISVTASGKNLSYAWYTCADALGTNPVAVDPAVNAAELDVTVGAADSYYKVVVSGDCGSAQEAVITVVARQAVASLVDVTGDMFWDFSKAEGGTTASSNMCNEAVLANVAGIVNNSDFESDNIMATANKFSSGKLQASMIKFHTTVGGVIKVVFSNTGTKTSERYLVVNGRKTSYGSKNQTALTYYGYVPAGDVVLTVVDGDGPMLNFTSVKFIAKAAPDYVRDDDWMAPGELGTFCIPQGAVAVGADMYELMGRDPESGKIAFDNVEHMEPGKPYLFRSNSYQIDFYYTDETAAEDPNNSGAMKGSFTDYTLYDVTYVYYFNGTALWSAAELGYLDVIANRAYVQMDEVVNLSSPSPAPGRRRITMGVHGEQTATGVDNVQSDDVQCTKLMIDGQLYILRGEQMYDATGRLVK